MHCLGSIEEKVRVRARARESRRMEVSHMKRRRASSNGNCPFQKERKRGETKKWAKIIHVVIEEGKVNLPVSMRVFCSVMIWRMQCNERMRRKLMDVTALHSFGEGKND